MGFALIRGDDIHKAIIAGDFVRVRAITWLHPNYLQEVATTTSHMNLGYLPLHMAILERRYEIADYLLANGADPNARSLHARWELPLHVAVRIDPGRSIPPLLARGAVLNATDSDGLTPLHKAAHLYPGNTEFLRELIALQADPRCHPALGYDSLLHAAARKDICIPLLPFLTGELGLDIHERSVAGLTPLQIAVSWGAASMAHALIALGADPKVTDAEGRTLLHRAVWDNELRITDFLLNEFGFDVNATTTMSLTPIDVALERQWIPMVKHLLARGARLAPGAQTHACLSLAVKSHFYDVIREVMAQGVDVQVRDADGRTALHLMAKLGEPDFLAEVLSRNPDVNAVDGDGHTALLLAIADNTDERALPLVTMLLEKGADPTIAGQREAPLALAVRMRLEKTAAALRAAK